MALYEKLLTDFNQLGPLYPKDASAAVQVYLELCEVKKYWKVEAKYHLDLRMLYFIAKQRKSHKASIFVPKCLNDELNFNMLQSYCELREECDIKNIYLVFVSPDSTCVYYQITNGLFKPVDFSKHSRANRQERLDAAIRKHRNLISEAALCGTSVTIRDPQHSNNMS